MSIIKHVTLQKIVPHDFRYNPRINLYILNMEVRKTGHKWKSAYILTLFSPKTIRMNSINPLQIDLPGKSPIFLVQISQLDDKKASESPI